MKKDPYAKEGYVYVYDYYSGRPIYYKIEEYEKIQAEEERKKRCSRIEMLEGYLIASDNLEIVAKIIINANDFQDAKEKLMKELSLTKKQASTLLQARMSKLFQLNREKINGEIKALRDELESETRREQG